MGDLPIRRASYSLIATVAGNSGDIDPGPKTPLRFADPFATAVQVTRMPMTITDPHEADNPIVFANDAFCQLTGYSRQEILGRNCRFLQGPKTDRGAVAQIHAAVQAEVPIEIEIRNYRNTGTPFWNRLLIAPVYDASGALAYFFANQIDVTAERERFMLLQNHNDALIGLTARLVERTRELAEANDKLYADIRKRKQVEASLRQLHKAEALGHLTSGIVHDFNNLVGGIIGSLELLQRSAAAGRKDDLERYTSAAIASAQRAATLTHRLLAFVRRQPLKPERIDARRLLVGIKELLQPALGPSIEVEMLLKPELSPIFCDPSLLDNAILNLAINARDAMPDGGRLIIEMVDADIDAASAHVLGGEIKPGCYVKISVKDTGSGMSSSIAAKAFDPFFTTKPVGHGTGVGLSMVYSFAKQSEGHVRLQSKLGQGTVVELYLPRYSGSLASDIEQALTVVDTPTKSRSGRTVLVVEDEDTFRMVVTETLQELGYTPMQAADGPSALRILQSDAGIDLLITDIGLPGLNGRQLAEAAGQVRPDLPVLFITGSATEDAADLAKERGAGTTLLAKPFSLDALAKSIDELL